MKKTDKLLSFIIVIQMMFMSILPLPITAMIPVTEMSGGTSTNTEEFANTEELMPMVANSCWVDGYTYATTADGLDEIGLYYTGSGKSITLTNPDYSIKQSQCGTDRCVFVSYKGEQTHWFKVTSW